MSFFRQENQSKRGVRVKKIKSYFLIFTGVLLMSISIGVFLVPNKIVSGGVSGLATVFYYVFNIPVGITYFVVNMILLGFGYKILGKKFVITTIISSGLVSALCDLFTYFEPVTDDVVLAALFGGVIGGVGMSLTLIENSSTGGTDVLSRIIQSKKEHLPIGRVLIIVDFIIILLSYFVFKNINLTLYGILSLFVCGTAIDIIISKLNSSKMAFVVTNRGEEISKRLINTSKRGVTMIKVKGAYTGEEKSMLICALKDFEVLEFKNKILEIDKKSFIMFCESEKILGEGFYIYH